MSDIESLQRRIAELERTIGQIIETDAEVQEVQHQGLLRENARVSALFSFVRELCLHAGVTQEQFQQHLEARINHYHAYYLEHLRNRDPNLAGRADNRTLDEVATERSFPPLFPK